MRKSVAAVGSMHGLSEHAVSPQGAVTSHAFARSQTPHRCKDNPSSHGRETQESRARLGSVPLMCCLLHLWVAKSKAHRSARACDSA